MVNLRKLLLPSIIGFITYTLVNRLFPERKLGINYPKDVNKEILGRNKLTKKIYKKIRYNRYNRIIRIVTISVFAAAGFYYFNEEIQKLLVADVFNHLYRNLSTKKKKLIISRVIREQHLDLNARSMQELIINTNFSDEDKVRLLKIKLESLLNGEYSSVEQFLILLVISMFVISSALGVKSISIMLEALYQLYKEGKISRSIYEEMVQRLKKRATRLPSKHLS